MILKWGRNAATKVPPRLKKGGASVYRKSTSLECLVRPACHKQHSLPLLSPPAARPAQWTAWQRETEREREGEVGSARERSAAEEAGAPHQSTGNESGLGHTAAGVSEATAEGFLDTENDSRQLTTREYELEDGASRWENAVTTAGPPPSPGLPVDGQAELSNYMGMG